MISQPGWAACLQRGLRCSWPFKKPSLVQSAAKVSQWVQLVLLSLSIPRYLPPSPSHSLWGHVLGTRIACDNAWALFTFHIHTHNAAYPCTDLDFPNKQGQGGDSSLWKEEVWRLKGCNHVRRTNKVLGTLCPTNLVTLLTGWWSHVGSICDRLSYQVYIVNLRLAVSAETSAVFALSAISSATERVQWVSVFVERFLSPWVIVCGMHSCGATHVRLPANTWV